MSQARVVATEEQAVSSKSNLSAHAALVAVQILFGTWPIVGKVALRALPSTGLVAFRVGGAALCFLLIRRFVRRATNGEQPRVSRKDYPRIALYSLLGVILNQFFFVKGLELSTVINAVLIGAAIPASALAVSLALGYERASLRKITGMLIAASGVVYLIDPARADFSNSTVYGNLLLVANTIAYGAYIAISQDVIKRYGALNVITSVFVTASIVAVPIGAYNLLRTPLAQIDNRVWFAVLFIILAPTVAAYYLNAWALSRVAPSVVAIYIYLQPLIAFAFAPILLGERPTQRTLIAALLICAGVGIVTLRAHQRERDTLLDEVSEHPDAMSH